MSTHKPALRNLRLFIWEGDGISSGYHNDGTLVVLAESAEQARGLVRQKAGEEIDWDTDTNDDWWDIETAADACERDPDRTLSLNAPTLVCFNGGGYD